jgi:UDP-N-acetylglucosamine/UDP-N-acetylgalactosamine diphosphorylase
MLKGRDTEEQRLINRVQELNQGHLFHFWKGLSENEKDQLIAEVKNIDFNIITEAKKLIGGLEHDRGEIKLPEVISIPALSDEIDREKTARHAGEEHIRAEKVAAFTAAGGQSSRLGLDIPKGAFPVTPVKNKSLFQVHAEKILFMERKYSVRIPWVIMVSGANRDQSVSFFRENNYFGLDKDHIRFIEQEMFPALDEYGKILLKNRSTVFLSPTGHGGTLSALNKTKTIDWLKELGVEEIFYFQVDNVLIKILDPVFIGYHVMNRCEMSSKAVYKTDPKEKIGVFAVDDGKVTVIEYSELSEVVSRYEDLSEESFTAGSVAIHMLNVDFIRKINSSPVGLPLHLAHKVISYMDMSGKIVVPEKPNGYKLETFIFDALKLVSRTIIMEVRREDEFSPLKNKTGADSLETVLRDQLKYFASWFEDAGICVPYEEKGVPVYKLEISPLFAALEEDFLEKIDRNMVIKGDIYVG